MGLFDLFQDDDAVHTRHPDIRDGNLRSDSTAAGQAALTIFRRVSRITGNFEGDPRYTPKAFLIINQNATPTSLFRYTRILAC